MSERILITGGAGFIGQQIIQRIQNQEVLIYDSLLKQVHGDDATPPAGAHFVRGDVADAEKLETVFDDFKPEHVIHLAAETGTGQSYDEPSSHINTNILGTSNILTLVRANQDICKSFTLASSRAVYGEGTYTDSNGNHYAGLTRDLKDLQKGNFDLVNSDGEKLEPLPMQFGQVVTPASVYASSKLMQEFLTKQLLVGTSVAAKIFRLQNVYGAGQSLLNPYTGVLSIFAALIKKGTNLNIFEDGKITRDFVNVADVAEAIVSGLKVEGGFECDIGSGKATELSNVANLLLKFGNQSISKTYVSGDFRPGDIRTAYCDITPAKMILDWEPKVDLETGLENLMQWASSKNED